MPQSLIFSPAAIAQSVHDSLDGALAAIPKGKSGAVFLDFSRSKENGSATAEILFVQKIGDDFAVAVGGEWSDATGGSQDFKGKIAFMGAWP